jgi:hypothetical protein
MEKYPYIVKHQAVLSTLEDSQGERCDKAFLDDLASSLPPMYPIGREHDMALDVIGYMENLRIEPIPDHPGEWMLIVDMHLTAEDVLRAAIGGFSYGMTVPYKKNHDEPFGGIFFPYPYYNDAGLVDAVLKTAVPIAVGKWRKKAHAPGNIALIASFVFFVLGPLWKNVFDERVQPFLERAIEACRNLGKPEMAFDLGLEVADAQNRRVQLYFVPDRKLNFDTLAPDLIKNGVERVATFLESDPDATRKGASLIKLYYDGHEKGYRIFFVQFKDGNFQSYIDS